LSLPEETAGKKKGEKRKLLWEFGFSSSFLGYLDNCESDAHISQRRGLSFNRHRSAMALALLIIVLPPITEDCPEPVEEFPE